ncbi:MAG: shikimate kinase [Chitinophagaceae bacterium]|nr:shikimate kinase [Chitinophagaceae bacterium]
MRIFLIGFMGSGKTYLGRIISEKLQFPFFDLDECIVSHTGKELNTLFAEEGEEYFRQLEKEILHMITESHEDFVMACGGGTPCFFNNIEYMKQKGMTVWIDAPLPVLEERLLKEKNNRPLIRDLPDEQLMSFISRKYADRKIYYEQAHIRVQEEADAADVIIQKIFHV